MIATEFFDLCAAHDWFYNFADDHSVWKRGEAERTRLVGLMDSCPDFRPIFSAWQAHFFHGGDVPVRPEVVTFEGSVPQVHPDQLTFDA